MSMAGTSLEPDTEKPGDYKAVAYSRGSDPEGRLLNDFREEKHLHVRFPAFARPKKKLLVVLRPDGLASDAEHQGRVVWPAAGFVVSISLREGKCGLPKATYPPTEGSREAGGYAGCFSRPQGPARGWESQSRSLENRVIGAKRK